MDKVYSRIIWQNEPSTATALGATNLNRMDVALNAIDDRVVGMDTSKADQSAVNNVVQSITYNDTNGVMTITKVNGTSTTIDTKLEKLAVNFEYNPETQQLDITLDDGTVQHVDLSALITQYEFQDTDTVSFSVQPDGKIKANVVNGSITAAKLQPNYLADIIVQANIATTNANLSKRYAVGGVESGDTTDNAKYYKEQAVLAKQAAEIARDQAVDISNVGIASESHLGLVKGDGNVSVNTDGAMWADPYKDKGTLTGPSVQFVTADDGLIEVTQVKGKSTQVVTVQGKNILPSAFSEWESGEYSSTTGAKTANASRVRCRRLIQVGASTTYYVLPGSTVFFFAIRAYDASGIFLSNIGGGYSGGVFSTPANTAYISVTLVQNPDNNNLTYADYQTAFSNGTIKPFICLNSESNKTYADFVPNSPSPDYPAPITSLGDSGSFVVGAAGKNLCPKFISKAQSGITVTVADDGTVTLNGTAASLMVITIPIVLSDGTYTLSANNAVANSNVRLRLSSDSGGANTLFDVPLDTVNKSASQAVAGAKYIGIRIGSGITLTNFIIKPQLESGTTATPYEPYKGNTITANSGGYSLPDGTADVLDFLNGKKTQNVGKVVLNGGSGENWVLENTFTNTIEFKLSIPTATNNAPATGNQICDIFGMVTSPDTERLTVAFRYCYVRINKSRLTTLDVTGFKTWLATHILTLYYKLDTPVITSLSRLFLTSYKGITNVYTLDPTQPEFTATAKSELWSKTYDTKASTVSFTQAGTLANIASGETHSTLFGKIAKFFSFIGTTALTTVAQTVTGAINELKSRMDTALTSTEINTHITDLNNFMDLNKLVGVNASITQNYPPGTAATYGKAINIGYAPSVFNQYVCLQNGLTVVRKYADWDTPKWGGWQRMFTTADIVNTDTQNVTDKPLGANVGYALGQEIDAIKTGDTIITGRHEFNKGVIPGAGSYGSAPIETRANFNDNNAVRAGIGFENTGYNAVFLYLDVDYKIKYVDNTGAIHTISSD